MLKEKEFLTIGEAADFLGVSPWTLRNWDKAGKLTPHRNPQSGYRLYRHEDLRALRDRTNPPATRRQPPLADWNHLRGSEHFVQFYESDSFLVESLASYVGASLANKGGAIVIATPDHRQALLHEVNERGLNAAPAIHSGQVLLLDAAATLSEFMVDGIPDKERFLKVVGRRVSELSERHGPLRAFGEMVALLWADGKRDAAVQLEEFWNELAKEHAFALLCAYPLSAFASEADADLFSQVCKCHSRVGPSESYAHQTTDSQARSIALLQQKALALEAEVARREKIEESLLRRERELSEAKEIGDRGSRAKDEFLAMLSHELRTPLTPVLMAVTAMETDPAISARMREDLAMIRRNISLETRLIDDLLDLSRITNGKMVLHKKPLHLHPLITAAVEMVAPEAELKPVHISCEFHAADDHVTADPARLHQVIWNLLKNAVKFTPANGAVMLCTRDAGGQRILLEIQDTGIGITHSALGSIFDAFDQGKLPANRSSGGLGLGLAISKAIIDMHGGNITAHSDGPDKGANFSIELPTTAAHDVPTRTAQTCNTPARPTKLLRILLVDDHRDTLRMLKRILEADGHHVTTAASVAEASELAANLPLDLLISDIGLPDGTGIDVLRALHKAHPNLPAIALTGFGMENDIHSSHAAGFSVHLTKPVDLDALSATIARLM